MRRKSFEDMSCSVAQCLEVVGEWWTMLVIRDLFLRVRRFDEIQQRLGISRNVLAERLDHLVAHGIVEKRPYQESPVRYDYVLTDRGRDLWPVLTAMREWGDKWAAPDGPPAELLHKTCGHRVHSVPTCSDCGEALELRDIRIVAGPGADPDAPIAPVLTESPPHLTEV
jgi:DNA-binding HxlR family transcriptional regulator